MLTGLRVVPLIRSASVYATYDRAVVTAALEWRASGEPEWHRGLPIVNMGGELRGAVIGPPLWRDPFTPPPGLTPDATYEYRLTVVHADTTQDQAVGTFLTTAMEPPVPKRQFHVNLGPGGDDSNDGLTPSTAWRSIGKFMNYLNGAPQNTGGPQPGDALVLFPGTYGEYINTRYHGGRNDAWIHVMALDPSNPPVLTGGTPYYGTTAIAYLYYPSYGYYHFKDIIFKDALSAHIEAWAPGFWTTDCSFSRWGAPVSAIRVRGSGGVGVIRPKFVWNPGDPTPAGISTPLTFDKGQSSNALGGISVLDALFDLNTQDNPCKMDGIWTYPEDTAGGGFFRDAEIHGGKFLRCPDDAFQVEGTSINVRAWGNYIEDCMRVFGAAQPLDGPTYLIRNISVTTAAFFSKYWNMNEAGWLKLGGAGMTGPLFILNNTYWAPDALNATPIWGDGPAAGVVARNNLLVANMRAAYKMLYGSPQDWDSNLYCCKKGSGYLIDVGGNTKYISLPAFSAATGQEVHGVEVPWADRLSLAPYAAAGDLTPGGAAVDRGEDIPGVTDGFKGLAPDIGALESEKTAQTYTITILQGEGGNTLPAAGVLTVYKGDPYSIQAIANRSYQFRAWVEGGLEFSTINPLTGIAERAMEVLPVFELVPVPGKHLVTITVLGDGSIFPYVPGTYPVNDGALFSLVARPAPDSRFVELRWDGTISKDPNFSMQVNADLAIVVVFEPLPSGKGWAVAGAFVVITIIGAVVSGRRKR